MQHYRIEIQHDPHSQLNPWDARIYGGEDLDTYESQVYGPTAEAALEKAQAWVRNERLRDAEPRSVIVDETGEIVKPEAVA